MNTDTGTIRQYATGATRDTATGKPCYTGFLSHEVIKRFGVYMLKHQVQSDGNIRQADNWKKGISKSDYMDSMFRHFLNAWEKHDRGENNEDDLCAILFNVQGYLYETVK